MKNVLIYPLDRETSPLLRYCNPQKLSFVGVVPKGRGYDEKDIAEIDGGEKTDVLLSEDFGSCLDACDTVVFLKGAGIFNHKEYLERIQLAHSRRKQIILSKKILDLLKVEGECVPYDEVLETTDITIEQCLENAESVALKKINVPIITVFGMGNFTNKFELQLAVREVFIKEGYKVLQFGSKEYASLLNFRQLPDFLYDDCCCFSKKILAFNQYLFECVRKEKPDVIILAAPGGILPLDGHFHNYFGELPYIIATAAQPDAAILSTYYFPEFNEEFLFSLREHMQHKYNCIVDYFNIANTAYSIDQTDSIPEIAYLTQSHSLVSDTIHKNIDTRKIKVFNVFDSNMPSIASHIMNDLVNNIDVI